MATKKNDEDDAHDQVERKDRGPSAEGPPERGPDHGRGRRRTRSRRAWGR